MVIEQLPGASFMTFTPNTIITIYILTSILPMMVALINWRRRKQLAAIELSRTMFFISIWMILSALELTSHNIHLKVFFLILENAVSGVFTIYLLIFLIRFYQLDAWLTPFRRGFLWFMIGLFILFELTNHLHHGIWQKLILDPADPQNLIIEHGTLYTLSVFYQLFLAGLILFILTREAVRARGWDRQRAVLMILSLLAPVFTYLIYMIEQSHDLGLLMMPLGLSVSGFIFTLITFEDLQHQVSQHSHSLEQAVLTLQEEIETRKQLESELLSSHETLATLLSEQSQKLVGLYNLILLGNKPQTSENLYAIALAQIRTGIGCDMVCFYHIDANLLKLQLQFGLQPGEEPQIQTLPLAWFETSPDVYAFINLSEEDERYGIFARAGYRACMLKWVSVSSDTPPGLLGIFWKIERNFAVEEIALFSASADILGVIDENARLRQATADTAIIQERRRLARDLHDSVTQSLHSLVLSAETAQKIPAEDTERRSRILKHLVISGKQALKEMRLLLFELRLASPFDIGLVEALKNRLEAVEHRTGIETEIHIEAGTVWPLPWEKELYPIAMEALNNSLKHARASRVEIHLRETDGQFEMQIIDNGCGFDPLEQAAGGMGLTTMRERAENINGLLQIISQAGEGTRVAVSIPIP